MGHRRQTKRSIKYRMCNTRYYNTQEKEIMLNVDSIIPFLGPWVRTQVPDPTDLLRTHGPT